MNIKKKSTLVEQSSFLSHEGEKTSILSRMLSSVVKVICKAEVELFKESPISVADQQLLDQKMLAGRLRKIRIDKANS